MSILNEEELNKKVEDRVERILPKESELKKVFHDKVLSVLLIDPDNDIPITKLENEEGLFTKYFDLAQCTDGDYSLILKTLRHGCEGLWLDNVDSIPDISDKEDIEELVLFALKREPAFPLPDIEAISFNDLAIAARCRKYPEYLNGKSLQALIIDMNEY